MDEDLWFTDIDPSQLENTLVNLAVNARDALPQGGSLLIETSNAVLDESPARSRTDAPRGEYVSKGHIEIRSDPGRGATIEIYLPRTDSAGERPAAAPAREATVLAGHETILLVEDEPAVRQVTRTLLAGLGYSVVEAATGAEALAVLDEGSDIDLLFTDMLMPGGMTGADVASRARARRPGLPVLYTSGYTATDILDKAPLPSGTSVLGKPYLEEDLARAVRDALDCGNQLSETKGV